MATKATKVSRKTADSLPIGIGKAGKPAGLTAGGKPAVLAIQNRTAAKAKAAAERADGKRSTLVDMPTAATGKALRRKLRAAGVWLSKDASIGKVPVKVKDGFAEVSIHGKVYRTAVIKD